MQNFKIYPINESSLEMYKKCFDENGSSKKTENIRWQFLQSTKSNSLVEIAFDEDKSKVAAIYAMSSVKMQIDGNSLVGSQSLDTITDVDYRGLGLFITMAKSVYEKADNDKVALVYGFPNGNSVKGFKKWLGWEILDPVPFLIKPLKSKYFTNKIKALQFFPNVNLSYSSYKSNKKFRVIEKNIFSEEVNDIWRKFSNKIKVAVERDEKYLDWRYIQKPNENYKIAHCYSIDNKYLGFIVYTVKEKHNGRIGYIMELMYDLEEPTAGKTLLDYAIYNIKKEKADCILSWCLEHSPNYPVFKSSFFIDLPEKYRPIELHFGVRAFTDKIKSIVSNRENWYLSYSDSDTV